MILDNKDYKVYEIYSQLATQKTINGKDMVDVLEEEFFKQQIDFSRIAFKVYRDELIAIHQGYALEEHDGSKILPENQDFLRKMYRISRLGEEGTIDPLIGRVVDYDVPIKRCIEGTQTDIEIGTIDLITETLDKVYLIETVRIDSTDRLMRAVLEIVTYCNMISRSKLIEDFRYAEVNKFMSYHSKKDLNPAILLFVGTPSYKDYMELKENSIIGMLIRKYNIRFFVLNRDEKYKNFIIEN